jgi:hypothetical protein
VEKSNACPGKWAARSARCKNLRHRRKFIADKNLLLVKGRFPARMVTTFSFAPPSRANGPCRLRRPPRPC